MAWSDEPKGNKIKTLYRRYAVLFIGNFDVISDRRAEKFALFKKTSCCNSRNLIREDILVINSGRVWKRYGQILSEVGFDDSTTSLCTPDIEFED